MSTENRLTDIDYDGDFAQAENALLRIDPSGENPDCTELYEILKNWKQAALSTPSEEEKAAIDFGTWYSGMERRKVESAYQRYKKERHESNATTTKEKIK